MKVWQLMTPETWGKGIYSEDAKPRRDCLRWLSHVYQEPEKRYIAHERLRRHVGITATTGPAACLWMWNDAPETTFDMVWQTFRDLDL